MTKRESYEKILAEKTPEITWTELCKKYQVSRTDFSSWKNKTGKTYAPKKKRNKPKPELITIHHAEKRDVKILIGDADAIGQIMTRLGY